MSTEGMPHPGVLPSSVRKLLKTVELMFLANTSVCNRIKRKRLGCCDRMAMDVVFVDI